MNKAIFGICLVVLAVVAGLPGTVGAQDRPVVAVIEFRNDSGAGWFRGGVGWELAGMLTNELAATNAFRVVERSKLEAVLEEQDLAASGRVKPGSGARIGQLTGAQYLVSGTVTSYEENTKGTGGGLSFKGVSLGGKSSEAYLAVDIRVINAETGEVDFVRTVEGRSKGGGVSVGLYRGGFGGNLSQENNTPVGKAIRAALVEITDYLECAMVKQDRCMDTYNARESKRRDSSRGAVRFD
jgi:curli biogenesis system outer membrane secretion channel CsgG